MSEVKINEDQFLGKQELNRLKESLGEKGFRRFIDQMTGGFGLVNVASRDASFTNFEVIQGTAADKITIKAGFAIDKNLDIIAAEVDLVDIFTIPTDSVPRFVFIEYNSTNEEDGTVSIATNGDLVGIGTLFTEVLRGQPNHSVKIKFTDSTGNLLEYEVLEVTNDTTATLVGATFVAESPLHYKVVGSFTPGVSIPPANKDIYIRDGFQIRIDLSAVHTADEEFILAEVTTNGIVMSIEDRRFEFFESKASFELRDLLNTISPCYGVESSKFDSVFSDRSTNLVRVAWGFRSPIGGWSGDIQNRKIVISTGQGGIYDTPAAFVTGDFDGWLVFIKEVGEMLVETSTKVGGTIELIVRGLTASTINPTVYGLVELFVVPNCSQAELRIEPQNKPNTGSIFVADNNRGFVDFRIKVGDSYEIKWVPLLGKFRGSEQSLIDGDYLNEGSFDDDGVQVASTTSSVVASIFTPSIDPDNFRDKKADLDEVNVFTARQSWDRGSDLVIGAGEEIVLDDTGNIHKVAIDNADLSYMTDLPEGTRIAIALTTGTSGSSVTINSGGGSPPGGTKPFFIPSGTIVAVFSTTIFAGIIQIFERYDDGSKDGWHWIANGSSIVDAFTAASVSSINDSRLDTIEAGWSTFGFAIGNFGTTNGGGLGSGWVVGDPNEVIRFKEIGKTMHMDILVTAGSVTAGTPSELLIKVPNSRIVKSSFNYHTSGFLQTSANGREGCIVNPIAGTNTIQIISFTGLLEFVDIGANDPKIQAQVTFEFN